MMFLKGLAFGFILAATVGPMWVLCFRRSIAAGAIAAFGLTAVSAFLLDHSFLLGVAGAAFLVYLGIKTLGLTLTNPPTILTFAAIFAGLGLAAAVDYGAAALITCGAFLGSAAWWLILAAAADRLRGRTGPLVR
jgi:threonine/homoserine/homoserine lactone efflux protein